MTPGVSRVPRERRDARGAPDRPAPPDPAGQPGKPAVSIRTPSPPQAPCRIPTRVCRNRKRHAGQLRIIGRLHARLPENRIGMKHMKAHRSGHGRILKGAALLVAAFFVSPLDVLSLRDETNQKRWNKPCTNGPDAEVPGFLVNMGPTGARGILKERSYVVKYIFPQSPAFGILKLDDEVVGANGKPFAAHTFGGGHHGLEGPLQDLGLAIEDSEGRDGVLQLMVKRGGKNLTVDIRLERLGRFADTFPVDCRKTQILKARACKYLVDHPGGLDSQGRCVATLALLSSDDPTVFDAGVRMAKAWNKPYNENTWSWHLGFQGIALAEYYLRTGDASVLKTLASTLALLRRAQWQGEIHRWKASEMPRPVDQEILDRHQALYDGGFGHCPYPTVVQRGGGGYGPMQWPTCLAIMAWQLGRQCGIPVTHPGVESAFTFLEYGTTKAGHVAYGGEFTLNNGPVDTERWQSSTRNSFSHKSGLAYLVYRLSPERPDATRRMTLHLSNIDAAYKDMADGHACAMMGFTWGLAGVYASGDAALKKKITDYYKAWLNLARCHGSDSYVILPGRDYADESYYRNNIRNHTTAAVAFVYSFSTPKLRVHGRNGKAVRTGLSKAPPSKGGKAASAWPKKPAAPKAVLKPDALPAWDTKLQNRVRTALQGGRKVSFAFSGIGRAAEIRSLGEDGSLQLRAGGSAFSYAWKSLPLKDRAVIAESLADQGEKTDRIVAAFFLMAGGRTEAANGFLRQLSEEEAKAVRDAFE